MFGRKKSDFLGLFLALIGILIIFISTTIISKTKDYETSRQSSDVIKLHETSQTEISRTTDPGLDEGTPKKDLTSHVQEDNDSRRSSVAEKFMVPKNVYRKAIEKITSSEINATLPTCVRNKEFCRYDDMGDFLEGDVGTGIVHEPVTTVPSSRRIPYEKANDWPYILEQRAILPDDGSLTALMDYNCILIPLFKNKKQEDGTFKQVSDLDPILLDHITGRYHPYFSDAEADKVKYLSVSRTSNLHSCKPKFKFSFGTIPQDFLGLSLLDENLAPIDGTDVAINVDKWIFGNMTAYFHDFQIIPVRTKKNATLKDQLFLFPSGHIGTYGFPINVRRMPPILESSKHDVIQWDTNFPGSTIPFSHEFMYGDGFEVQFHVRSDDLKERKPYVRGDALFQDSGIDRGKNFHFFEIGEGANSQSFLEFWPHGTHRTVPINFFLEVNETNPFVKIDHMLKKKHVFPPRRRFEIEFLDKIESTKREPNFSWTTWRPKDERPKKRFRGTSQIIDFDLRGKKVKLGISHTVSEHWPGHVDKRAYLSHFYAFEPEPPFDIVALSGHFCFNHMHEEDVGYDAQWISKRDYENRTAPILISDANYRCPIITFASGLTEMVGHDGEYVIITYGVNDCYSRSLVIPKKKIEMLLLTGIASIA